MKEGPQFYNQSRPFRSLGRVFIYLVLGVLLVVGLSSVLSVWSNKDYGSGEKVALIEINGVITYADDIIRQISRYRRDESIKGIILRIDSPGGAVAPSQEIYREILKTREKKKVVASLASLAASGGYYIASAASYVIASPGTLTGSIGVIFATSNIEELIQKIGLKPQVIKSGKFKDAGSPVRPMTEEERALLQSVVDDVHDQFVQAIKKGRGLLESDIRQIADGRVLTGRQALDLKLIDQLGTLEDAVQWIQDILSLKERPRLIRKKEEKSLLDFLLETVTPGKFVNSFQWSSVAPIQYLWKIGMPEVSTKL